jgi:osmotically-inducible protein OsmY
MSNLTALLTGASIGAGAMYVLDPQLGRRRRALARDKLVLAQRKTQAAASVTARDLKNRTAGLVAEGRSRFMQGGVDDEVLRERVRSKLGFLVRHPSAIEAQVSDGHVVLSGHVLSD